MFLGGVNDWLVLLEGMGSVNAFGELYWQLPIVIKDAIFGGKLQCLSVIMHERQKLNYRDVRGNIYLHKVCFYIYSPCHCYACR